MNCKKSDLRKKLFISPQRLKELNMLFNDPSNSLINRLLELIDKYGGPEEINRRAEEAGRMENLKRRLEEENSPYLDDIVWLEEQREKRAFVSLQDYRRKVLGKKGEAQNRIWKNPVTLEISALQFFPWLISEAKHSIERQELMPGRIIRVRNMKEQERDMGDLLATAAAVKIIGSSFVEALDTRGTDGSNIHLGGLETITGYFGGVGQPNNYPLKWAEEYLYYYTNYGIRQVLNINAGTILIGYLMHKLGINNEFKISVFVGIDNPFSVLWALMLAKLFSREDGSTSLVGLNFSNSVNKDTILESHKLREAMGLTSMVRLEHHVTETYRSIVRQPYNRREELVEIASVVPNISAKHEGGDPEIDANREHPSDVLDYFLSKEEIENKGLMKYLEQNYLDKHDAMNRTAEVLTKAGIGIICAQNLH